MKKIIQILTIATIMLAWGNQSLAQVMAGPQAQQKLQEGIRAIEAGNFNRAQQIIDELNKGRRPQQAQQLSQQLQQAQAGRAAPTPAAPAGLLDTCDQQVDALLRYFGRYPVGQPINSNKKVATKDLLIDTYNLLEAIGIPRQATAGGFGLPVIFGPGGVSIPDFYGFGDVLNMIKQRFDVLAGLPGGVLQQLQPLFQALNHPSVGTPAQNISDALANFKAFGRMFNDTQTLTAMTYEIKKIFQLLNNPAGVPAENINEAITNFDGFTNLIGAGSIATLMLKFRETVDPILAFLSDGLGNPANDLATARTNIQDFLTHISNAGFVNLNNLTELGMAIATSTLKPTEKNNLLIIKRQLIKMHMPINGQAVHNWFTSLSQQDQQLAYDLFVQNAVILLKSNIQ